MKDIETPMNNGEKWYAWVDYNGATDIIEVRLSQNSTRPQAFLLKQNIDLVNILGKTDVFVGFSSGTGAAGNKHDILSWEFRGNFDPIGESAPKHGTLTVLGEGEGVAAPGQVELILDASGSMVGKTSDGERKIDVAKRVIRVLTEKLPKNMMVALRVYGHRLPKDPKGKSCADSELVSPFTPLGKSNINTILSNIHPKGQTPIGFSLSKLMDDLKHMPGEKLVVLVSDGIETCNTDPNDPLYPPRILKSLQNKGVKVKVNVIGFDIGESETRAFLKSIADASDGMYLNAGNAKELDKSISKAISAKFDISDAKGNTVLKGTVGDKSLTVNEGIYTLKIHANPDIVIPNLAVEGGKETKVFVRKSKGSTDVKKTISELTKTK